MEPQMLRYSVTESDIFCFALYEKWLNNISFICALSLHILIKLAETLVPCICNQKTNYMDINVWIKESSKNKARIK